MVRGASIARNASMVRSASIVRGNQPVAELVRRNQPVAEMTKSYSSRNRYSLRNASLVRSLSIRKQVFLESGGSWDPGSAYFSSLEAPGTLDLGTNQLQKLQNRTPHGMSILWGTLVS